MIKNLRIGAVSLAAATACWWFGSDPIRTFSAGTPGSVGVDGDWLTVILSVLAAAGAAFLQMTPWTVSLQGPARKLLGTDEIAADVKKLLGGSNAPA